MSGVVTRVSRDMRSILTSCGPMAISTGVLPKTTLRSSLLVRKSYEALVNNMLPPSRPAIEYSEPLVRIGDIVRHPKYGIGLVIGTGHIPGFMKRALEEGSRVVAVYSVLWSDGEVDDGWPAARLANFVCTSRGLNT